MSCAVLWHKGVSEWNQCRHVMGSLPDDNVRRKPSGRLQIAWLKTSQVRSMNATAPGLFASKACGLGVRPKTLVFFCVSNDTQCTRVFDALHNPRSWNGMRNHQMAAVMILVQAGTGDCVSGPRLVTSVDVEAWL